LELKTELGSGSASLEARSGGTQVPQFTLPPAGRLAMQFVVHAIDKADILVTRAKFYRQHRIHLDEAGKHGIAVLTAGTLVADDGETPIGSLFVVDAEDRTTLDAFTSGDPYYINGVWETLEIHAYRKKRGS
jgi:uncharacterized protein